MPTPLLSTKYHLPPVAQVPVQRSRLLARLDELLLPGKRLALVSSLAGSGKTTLVRSWVEQMLDPGSLSRQVHRFGLPGCHWTRRIMTRLYSWLTWRQP